MQFYINADLDAAILMQWVIDWCAENGLGTELEEQAHRTELRCPRFALSRDADPDDAQSRREFAEYLRRDYGVTVSTAADLDGQLYSSCSDAQFADLIGYLLGKFGGDFFLWGEFDAWILCRKNGAISVADDWKELFSGLNI